MAIHPVLSDLLDMVLPPRCVLTGAEVDSPGMLAPPVWAKLNFIARPLCARCGIPFDIDTGDGSEEDDSRALCGPCLNGPPLFARARAALRYDDFSRDIILAFKHGDRTEAVRAFAPWMARAGADLLQGADVLTPVPLHRWRLLRRRYNQSALLAGALSRLCGLRWLPDVLLRTRATPAQGHMSPKERARNVHDAFAVPPRRIPQIKGKRILLIDDVYTSGATANACALALMQAGAQSVDALTLARVVRGS